VVEEASMPSSAQLVAVVLAAMASAPLAAAELPPLEQALQAAFARADGAASPGAAVVVLHDGAVVLSRVHGLANLAASQKVTTTTRFRLASVSKSFTALVALQLVEEGRLGLDEPVARYVPGFVGGEAVRVRHVLSHTAGLPDFVGLDAALSIPLDGAPGERLNYSNVGYALLARVIEKASGRGYEAQLRARILDPLGMKDTGVGRGEPVGEEWARGYLVRPEGGFQPAEFTAMGGESAAAGGLYSTAEDMTRWLQALLGGRIVSLATLREATTPTRLADGRPGAYGLGFMTIPFRGLAEFGHGGDISGFNSWFSVYPDERLAVVVLSNVGMRPPGPLPTAGDIAHAAVAAVAGERLGPEWPAVREVPGGVLERYAGRYRLLAPPPVLEVMGATLDVRLDGTRVYASSKMGEAEIYPESETAFYSKGPARITFAPEADGSCNAAVLTLMGVREFRLQRER
jgi:CubicO group peptidase (beta-lactamase class C family)